MGKDCMLWYKNIGALSLNEPKMENVLFMNNFKKGMSLILFLFVDNGKWFKVAMIYNFYLIMSWKYVLYLDLRICNYIFIMFCELLYLSRDVFYRCRVLYMYLFRIIITSYG